MCAGLWTLACRVPTWICSVMDMDLQGNKPAQISSLPYKQDSHEEQGPGVKISSVNDKYIFL